jgi:hypothetical protein
MAPFSGWLVVLLGRGYRVDEAAVGDRRRGVEPPEGAEVRQGNLPVPNRVELTVPGPSSVALPPRTRSGPGFYVRAAYRHRASRTPFRLRRGDPVALMAIPTTPSG